MDDETLMQLIASRQQSALGELYDRYSRLVYSIAMNTVDDASRAEEITQDVFIRVWEKAHTYQVEQGKVTTWLTTITRNRAIDDLRRLKSRPEGNRDPWITLESLEIDAPEQVEAQVELSLQSQQLRRAFTLLTIDQRQALAYAYFMGYSHGEIAEALQQPLGTVKTRIRLGMQKLRQVLLEEKPDEE